MNPDRLPEQSAPNSVPVPVRHLRTRGGAEFDPTADRWAYRDGVNSVSLDFADLTGLSPALLHSAKATLSWYAQHRSPDTLKNLFTRVQHFVRTTATETRLLDNITAVDLLNYRSHLNESTAWYLGTLAGVLRKWHGLGYAGVSDEAVLLLKQLRLKGNIKGQAVLTMDPDSGPFTQIEAEALQLALNTAYETGRLETSEFVLAWLYILLGQRSKQHAALKVCDVRVDHDAEGVPKYVLMMPSAKKRTDSARDKLVARPLIEEFGEILVDYARSVQRSFAGVLSDPTQAPLFPTKRRRQKDPPGFEYHSTSTSLGQLLVRTLECLSVRSERTGKTLHVGALRFRRTIGTRAAEEGHGPLVIARLLDHTDTQNVGVYTASSPRIIERIDKAIAMQMAPLAQAFAGVVADGNDDDRDPARRIVDLRIDRSGQAMGECGKHGFCGFNAPIACYTCRNFEAWIDGPHEAVLDHLIARREQLAQTSDLRMASVNDRTILAVAAVVQRCTELKSARCGGLCG